MKAVLAALSSRLWQCAVLVLLTFGILARPAFADPALWVLRDADSTIYLFGTVHAMKPGVNWHNAKIDKAFASSGELWVEETGDEDQAAMAQLVARYGIDPQHPLSAKLTPPQRQKMARATQAAKLNLMQIDQTRPWLAAVTLSVVPLIQAGFDPNNGIDHMLRASAAAVGKPIHAFETPERQIRIFADLPPQDELALLSQTLDEIDEGPAYIGKLIDDWLRGDTAAIDKEVSADMRDQTPSLYKAVFLDRNVAWTQRIEAMMAGQGTAFIAVGAGHLAGKDSVINMLNHDGYKVVRE
ncbi:MAG TPA: TraB/GumN family protein [Dongiaceae bacterium]|nr:TraB/GumN family protein [Dongiaceae bacterium]